MTSSIPDGFSLEQLQQMMENAPSESCDHDDDDCTCGGPQTRQQSVIFDDIKSAIDEVNVRHNDPAVMKMAAIIAMTTLLEWHHSVAERKFHKSELVALGWCADSRSLEIAMDIISRINVGENDWMTED